MDKKDILTQLNRDDGRRVPDGYFADFEARMAAALPEQPWEKEGDAAVILQAPRTFWQKVRPYVYLAAMFAGIWCLMNIFSIAGHDSPEQMIADNPVLAEAIADKEFVDDIDISDYDLDTMIDDMYSSGMSVADMRARFEDGTL